MAGRPARGTPLLPQPKQERLSLPRPAEDTRPRIKLSELINAEPKQRQFLDMLWNGVTDGDPEYGLFGGAAGGGKSHILRWAAVFVLGRIFNEYKLENVRVGLFCEDYPALEDRHLSWVRKWPEALGTYSEQHRDFTLTKNLGGGVICFRNLDKPEKYASAEFAVILVDELTKNTRETFEELRYRKRWPGIPNSPFFAATNPKDRGLPWVRKLWIEHDFGGDQDSGLKDAKFGFIQATVDDNPHLADSYRRTLDTLGPVMRKALRDGDWYTFEGQAFPEFTRELHVIPTDYDLIERWKRIAGHDWGFASPGGHQWWAVDPDGGAVCYREWKYRKLDPHEIADGILYRQGSENVTTFGDPSIWAERRQSDLNSSQIETLSMAGKLQLSKAEQYREVGLTMFPASNARIAGKGRLHTLMTLRPDGVPWLRVMDCCPETIKTFQNIALDPEKNEDVITDYLPDDDVRDEFYDCARYAIMGIPAKVMPHNKQSNVRSLSNVKERIIMKDADFFSQRKHTSNIRNYSK